MKVLVCIPCLLNGGTEIQTLSLVEALVRAGHETVVACYFEHDAGMVQRYRDIGAKIRLMSPNGFRPQGVKPTVQFLWRQFRQLMKEFRPDVAHVQYMAPGALPVVILKLLGIRRIVATAHTNADLYSKNGLRMLRGLSRYCIDAFQCITRKAEEGFFGSSSMFDGHMKKHFTIYNALPSHISIIKEPRCFNPNRITVGVVSRLAEIKGMDLVIPAFEKARLQDSRLRLLIVGDGTLRGEMDRQAATSRFAADIEFVGMKPQSELQNWYDRIDILLMPSRSEGFGLTALEGMARGCVPVVANTGGLPEVVTADCGYLHSPEDIEEISQKILEASLSLNEKSDAAIIRAELFSQNNYNRLIDLLYRDIR